MRNPIQTLLALEPGLDRAAVEATLPLGADLELIGVAEPGEEWEAVRNHASDVLVVVCRPQSPVMLELIEQASQELPDRAVVVVTGSSPNGFMRRIFEAGAEDVVVADEIGTPSDELSFAVEKAVARRRGTTARESRQDDGELICVLGPKGGIGKTLTTANLTVALADAGHRVVAVDLDLQFGDLGLTLGLVPERTSYDLASSGGSLDAGKVGAYMTTHESGAHVLLAPIRPEQASVVNVEFLRELYPVLRKAYDFVVVDTPPGFSPEVIATVDSSSRICMVGMLDALSLKNTKLGLETLARMGYDRNRIRTVLNRADTNVGVSLADTTAIVGRAPDILIPSHRDITRSVNAGQAIVLANRRSEAARSFRALAELFVAASLPEGQPSNGRRRRGLLRRERG
jgi:pilus assembly protein CpaE